MDTYSRGLIKVDDVLDDVKSGNYTFLNKLDLGFNLICSEPDFIFAAVDIFASFPLFYTIVGNRPYVSEDIDFLSSKLSTISFNPIGFYCSTGLGKNVRTPDTPIKEIKRILPGNYLEFKNGELIFKSYCDIADLGNNKFKGSFNEAAQKLGSLIKESVDSILDFDPHCALHLSGGLDSGSLCSLVGNRSKDKRNVYYIKHGEQVESVEQSEYSFINLYKKEYPHFDIQTISADRAYTGKMGNLDSLGNWYGIIEGNNHQKIINHAAGEGIKTIITGLGGDEFASAFYSENLTSQRFFTDEKDLNKKRAFISSLKESIVTFFKDYRSSKSISNSLLFYQLRKNLKSRKIMFSRYFNSQTEEIRSMVLLSLGHTPMSNTLRLQQIKKQFFTIRSDKWNFMGKGHQIDFIHPLLNKKIIDFCLSLPLELFYNSKPRELFRGALQEYISPELLQGVKRPSVRIIANHEWQTLLDQLTKNESILYSLQTAKNERFFNLSKLLNFNKKLQSQSFNRSRNKFYLVGMFNALIIQTIFALEYFKKYFE